MELLVTGLAFLEAPVWDEKLGLLFADAMRGGVYRLNEDLGVTPVIEHRRGIGGAVRHALGGLIVSGRNVAHKSFLSSETVILADNDIANGIVGFNDITTDSKGRIYAGALGFVPSMSSGFDSDIKSAPLLLIDLDGSTRTVYSAVKLSNGLGLSPTGTTLYHADSGDRRVYTYDVSSDGSLSNRKPFTSVNVGLPDGLAVSADGCVWLADAEGGRVLRLSPTGTLNNEVKFPVPIITSLCFGGADMMDVYVVSGSDGSKADAGSIFRLRSDVRGLVIPPARVTLPLASQSQ